MNNRIISLLPAHTAISLAMAARGAFADNGELREGYNWFDLPT